MNYYLTAMKEALKVLLLSVAIMLTAAQAYSQIHSPTQMGGTIVVMTPTKDGVLLCGDNRVSTETGLPASNTFIKVRSVGQQGLYAATGSFYLARSVGYPPREDLIDFALYESIASYFQINGQDITEATIAGLGRELVNRLQGMDPKALNPHYPLGRARQDGFVFQALFIFVDERGGFRGKILHCAIISTTQRFRVRMIDLPTERFHTSLPLIMGGTAVYNEIISGTDQRFEDARADKRFKQIMSGTVPVKKLTAKEALRAARRLVELTSERVHFIDPKTHVSRTSDCALLSNKGKIKWLPQATPPKR